MRGRPEYAMRRVVVVVNVKNVVETLMGRGEPSGGTWLEGRIQLSDSPAGGCSAHPVFVIAAVPSTWQTLATLTYV